MGLTIATALRSTLANALVDSLDAGSGPGVIRVYGTPRPAGPDTSAGAAALLLEFTLNDPAFGAAASGVATLDADPALNATGQGDGTAVWFRALDSNNVAYVDGSVTATGNGGDLTLSSTTIATGTSYQLLSGTITMPAS